MRTRFFLLLIFAVVSIASWVMTGSANVPEIFQQVELKYAAAKTFKADFQQKKFVKAFEITKESKGKIFLSRPNKIRWEIDAPDSSLMVMDGDVVKIYKPPFDATDPEDRGQLIIDRADHVQSDFVRGLLAGQISVLKGMTITKLSESLYELKKTDGKPVNSVRSARIEVDTNQKLIKKISLSYVEGNETDIFLTAIELGASLPEKSFTIDAPAHTDIIDRIRVTAKKK